MPRTTVKDQKITRKRSLVKSHLSTTESVSLLAFTRQARIFKIRIPLPAHEFTEYGTHTLRWVYVKDDAGSDGWDCAWIDGIVLDFDPIPDIGDSATPEDVREVLSDSADGRTAKNITDAASYKNYRLWAERVAAGGVTKRQIKDSPNAWLSYVLDVSALIQERPRQGDVTVAALAPNCGSVTLSVSVKGVRAGDNATEANVQKVFAIEGAANVADEYLADAVVIETAGVTAGNVFFTVKPKDKTAFATFFKVKMYP